MTLKSSDWSFKFSLSRLETNIFCCSLCDTTLIHWHHAQYKMIRNIVLRAIYSSFVANCCSYSKEIEQDVRWMTVCRRYFNSFTPTHSEWAIWMNSLASNHAWPMHVIFIPYCVQQIAYKQYWWLSRTENVLINWIDFLILLFFLRHDANWHLVYCAHLDGFVL